jgi:hypothetical protein
VRRIGTIFKTEKGKQTMNRTFHSLAIFAAAITSTSLVFASGPEANLAPAALAVAAANSSQETATRDLQPFTNVAHIPVGAELSSIKFESAKAVKVATKRKSITNSGYCESLREPGGSILCSATQDGSVMPAYRVTYSYQDLPMASDETGSTRFTFNVYFRPEELSPALREAIAAQKIKGSDAEAFFDMRAQRGTVQVSLVDEPNSTFCESTNFEGTWKQTDETCRDKVVYRKASVPAGYIVVKVKPLNPLDQHVASVNSPLGR